MSKETFKSITKEGSFEEIVFKSFFLKREMQDKVIRNMN